MVRTYQSFQNQNAFGIIIPPNKGNDNKSGEQPTHWNFMRYHC